MKQSIVNEINGGEGYTVARRGHYYYVTQNNGCAAFSMEDAMLPGRGRYLGRCDSLETLKAWGENMEMETGRPEEFITMNETSRAA